MCQECAFQHVHGVFCCQSALTCGVSIIVPTFLPLFLVAGVSGSYSVQTSLRHAGNFVSLNFFPVVFFL